ncbi:MAG TPA: hypothetical protein VFG10_08305 [Saprospiraceae bacterium]|nr:hypothetical protein [Saprospiraceae bacterium]
MMKVRLFSLQIILLSVLPLPALNAQQPLLQFEDDFYLKSAWQEYMPEAYAINDSIIVTAGLNTNVNTLSMNLFVRWMHVDGTIQRETEILNIENPDAGSYYLPSYRIKSAIDDNFIYLISVAESAGCESIGEMYRTYHFSKVSLSNGMVEKDTFICFDDIRVYQDLSTFPGNDTLYLYGSKGYLNQNPLIILTTLSKDFTEIESHEIQTEDTHLLPLGDQNDPRAVAGSHHPYDDDYENQDVWFGKIEGDSIRQDFSMKYFDRDYLRKSVKLDDRETAFVSYDILFAVSESSIYLFRDDTLRWNFYDASFIELEDIQKIGDHYCILESSFRHDDDRQDKIILHFIDEKGFPYASKEFVTPWIAFAMTGLLIDDYYFAFVYINNYDVFQQVSDGEILIEDAHFEYTHVFKLRINE